MDRQRVRAPGLQPAGQDGTYYQSIVEHYRDLAGPPSLTLYGPDGAVIEAQYGRDYVLNVAHYDVGGAASGEVVLIAERPGYVFAPETVASTLASAYRTSSVTIGLCCVSPPRPPTTSPMWATRPPHPHP